jgi:hypothetical protein
MEALRSYETSDPTRATLRNIPEDGILHSHRRKNLKSYIYSHKTEATGNDAHQNVLATETEVESLY